MKSINNYNFTVLLTDCLVRGVNNFSVTRQYFAQLTFCLAARLLQLPLWPAQGL